MHHWAAHGIVGRGILLDYRSYALANNKAYDPYTYHPISLAELSACGKAQGLDIRPRAQGGDIEIGDILMIRSGYVEAYYSKTPDERAAMSLRKHVIGPEDGQRYVGIMQEEAMVDWLHDCYFAAVAGDAPSFEAWPSHESRYSHPLSCFCRSSTVAAGWDALTVGQSIISMNTSLLFGECRSAKCSTSSD